MVSDEVLIKLVLTEEKGRGKKHPEAGYRISQSPSELSHISNYILNHHEHWDGWGYPLAIRERKYLFIPDNFCGRCYDDD